MTTTADSVRLAQAAQIAMFEAQAAFAITTSARDAAVVAARQSGASAIDIADALGLSRQQIHKILEKNTTSTVHELRAEVITGDAKYEDLIEDDQWFVDTAVAEIAKKRGISL